MDVIRRVARADVAPEEPDRGSDMVWEGTEGPTGPGVQGGFPASQNGDHDHGQA